ncbi:MAG: DUF397 domain-containing protein [Thermoguttaceae bacterium]|nr:DUF397 domain-containing protein [Thermoguttaceae bacterium]MBR6437544.1 DUF397 domain-containing protein [Thermoguttaceae bacterium]
MAGLFRTPPLTKKLRKSSSSTSITSTCVEIRLAPILRRDSKNNLQTKNTLFV